ncbi:hypothetical protein CVIRNUC_004898 [Coccomyxa viridis]|uniref:Translation initiation factor eIF2B subunit epsilon n=1 Tax=Coccomyxa viridis TaxID=1274662 RepID=A0AAV1I5G2_9CHLO|nr:hypothetical protein CVIRNUC_004898 [Coccomyxa viridis]
MAPKKVSGAPLAAGEEPLTAVLLADSFTQRFRPMSLEKPKVLLPLVGVPMINYTLEWLASNKMVKVYVFCCAHAEQVKQHLESTGWTHDGASMDVQVIVSTACKTAGEALREVDIKDVIKSDFVLVSGDVVSNMDLGAALEAHKMRRDKNKNALMTMVMKAGITASQRRRRGDIGLTLAMDPKTRRLLRYEEVEPARAMPKQAVIDAHFWGEADEVEVRADLADTHIYICAPEVLMLFSDNFDYQNVQRDFVLGVLSEEELGQQIHIHELFREYATCVQSLRAYDAVSRDILQRWTFPFVPDTNLLPLSGSQGVSKYTMSLSQLELTYREDNIVLGRTAVVGHDTALGQGTVIGDGAQVEASVIGRDCHIGRGAHITGCHLLDNVRVGDQAQISHSLLCDNVHVGAEAMIFPGSVLSFRVRIGEGHQVERNTNISMCQQLQQSASLSDDELEYAREGATSPPSEAAAPGVSANGTSSGQMDAFSADGHGFDQQLVGPKGQGYRWHSHGADVDVMRFSIAPPPPLRPVAADDLSDEESQAATNDEAPDVQPMDPDAAFRREVSETFLRCVAMGYDQDLAVIELNGLKIAEARDFADNASYIVTTILSLCLPAAPRVREEYRKLFPATTPDSRTPAGRSELITRLKAQLRTWAPLLQKFLRSADDQVNMMLTIEEFCGEEGIFENTGEQGRLFEPVFAQLLAALYEQDVLEEDAVLQWAQEKEHADEEDKVFLRKAEEFIQWLQEAEEESDEDEDDE